jgi:tungstate transport system ATP-binding protein
MQDPIVKLEALNKTLEDRLILESISFSVFPSEILTIIGPNGSGKTTILRIVNLLMEGSKGKLRYAFEGLDKIDLVFDASKNNEKSISEREKIYLKRQMHLIFQKPVVFSGSVLENCLICGPLRGKKFTRREAMEALERVEIAHLYRQSAQTLSGGEMTRLALARSRLIKPQLLLLDEPSANLDPLGIKLFEELLCSMVAEFGTGIVLVTQDLFEARRISNRVGLLLHGHIVELQNNPDFFEHPSHDLTHQFLSGCLVL